MTFGCLSLFRSKKKRAQKKKRPKNKGKKIKEGEAMALRKPECESEHLRQVPRVPCQLQTEETALPRKLSNT